MSSLAKRVAGSASGVVAIVTLAAAALACGGAADEGTGGEAPETRFLSVGTAPPGGAFFVVGGAIGEVLSEHGSEHGWQVTSEATMGSQENIRRLDAGEIDIALSNAAITYHAVRGEGDWDQAYDVRSVMTLAPNVALFITLADSEVETIADLAGRRAFVGPAGAGFEYFVRPIVEAHGIGYDEIEVLHGTQAGAVDMLSDGSAAAAFLGGAVPTASITQAAASQDIRFVPFDGEARARLIEEYPFFRPATIPAGTYRGQDEDFQGLDVGSMHLITAADADEELVYRITKVLYENRDAVTERHPAGNAINPENVVRRTGTGFHPGAVRYYREIGIWADEGAGENAAARRTRTEITRSPVGADR